MNNLELAGWVYALYVEKEFIEYFDNIESAQVFAKKHYSHLSVFIKPVSYFKFVTGGE